MKSLSKLNKRNEAIFKVITLGDIGVGKTSLMNKLVNNTFSATRASVGIDMLRTKMKLAKTNQDCELRLWDTAGQEKFKTLGSTYFKSADGVLLVFDITNKESFDSVAKWFREMETHLDPNDV